MSEIRACPSDLLKVKRNGLKNTVDGCRFPKHIIDRFWQLHSVLNRTSKNFIPYAESRSDPPELPDNVMQTLIIDEIKKLKRDFPKPRQAAWWEKFVYDNNKSFEHTGFSVHTDGGAVPHTIFLPILVVQNPRNIQFVRAVLVETAQQVVIELVFTPICFIFYGFPPGCFMFFVLVLFVFIKFVFMPCVFIRCVSILFVFIQYACWFSSQVAGPMALP